MFSATNARTQSVTSIATETEIALLNLNVIKAVNAGNVTVTVNKLTTTTLNGNTIVGSPMTLGTQYYTAWQTGAANALASGQMQSVIDNFAKLEYTLGRISTDGTNILLGKYSW
jgi:hypothetical protein